MAFFLVCGTHAFNSRLQGYENVVVQCQNCGNMSARPSKRWEWFTVCFVPLIPFSLKPWEEVACPICNFRQDIRHRPDAQQQMQGGGGGPNQYPMQNQGPPPPGPPPGAGNMPQYK